MENSIFIFSDPHFGHKNIVRSVSSWDDKSGCRDFNSIEEMNETMQFTVPERKIIPINNDPFVFQVTPIGVMIHSKWGVEAEDNIFDNIKPL